MGAKSNRTEENHTHHGDVVVHVVAVDTVLDTGLVTLVPAPVASTHTLPGPVDFCTAA